MALKQQEGLYGSLYFKEYQDMGIKIIQESWTKKSHRVHPLPTPQ